MRLLFAALVVVPVLGSSACASTSVASRSGLAEVPSGEYRLTASVRVRVDTEHRERTQTVSIEAQLDVTEAGGMTLSADTGPCVELGPSANLSRTREAKRFDCGESSFTIESLRGAPSGFVTRYVDDFLRHHSGCRRSIVDNGRRICVEQAYTVVHRRRPQSAELNVRPITRGPA